MNRTSIIVSLHAKRNSCQMRTRFHSQSSKIKCEKSNEKNSELGSKLGCRGLHYKRNETREARKERSREMRGRETTTKKMIAFRIERGDGIRAVRV